MFTNYAAHAGILSKNFLDSNLAFCQATGWQEKKISSSQLTFRAIGMSDDGRYQTFTAVSGAGTAGNPSKTYPFISSDYGNTWKQITGDTSVLPYWHDNISQTVKIFGDGKTQMVVGPRAGNNSGPYLFNISNDYGNTWTIFTSSNNLVGSRFDASDDYKVMALVGLEQSAQVSITHDSGVTWFEPVIEGIVGWGEISMSFDGKYILALELNSLGDLFISQDSGVSWEMANLPLQGSATWEHPKISKDGSILLIGRSTNADLYRSSDYGDSWQLVLDRPVTDTWRGFEISRDNKYALAATNGGPLYRSKNSGVTWELIDLSKYGSPPIGELAISANGRYQSVTRKGVGTIGDSVYINCNFGLDPGQIA
jgi:photosystem II stability/assembly factor-like uncharacterized protein